MKLPRIASMEIRLTLLLGIIALVVSSIAGYTLFWALKREVQRQEITEVAGKLELINHLIGMQTTLAQMQDLRGALDNIMVGHGNLKTWITLADGSVFYGEAPPVDVRPLSGREIRLHSQDGWNMRGLRVPLEGTLLPGAELTVAVNLRPGTQFLYAFATALVLICATWVGATLVLSAWAVRRSLSPIRRLSQQAARIQPDNLAVRLPEQGIDRELREFTHTFNGMLGRVQTAYQQMEGFNADVAHELRTPLATLINGTEVILASDRPAHELRETLASNLEELESLKSLVNDMLFLARADGGERAADLAPVRLDQEARRVAEFYEAALEDEGVHLRIEGAATVSANANLLRRALANLVANAMRATPRGGELVIACAPAPDGRVRLSVRNPGAPIPAADLPRIFDRFFRGSASHTPRGEGHGLGLAIVRAIARMHGGEVQARSDRGGTEIGLLLPGAPHITEK